METLQLRERKDETEYKRCWSEAERAFHADGQPGSRLVRFTHRSNSGSY